MASKIDKVINGLQKLASLDGFRLHVAIEQVGNDPTWQIQFSAGSATVQATLENFINHPRMVLEPFCEELIKRN